MSTQSETARSTLEIYANYPFDLDVNYQQGLASLIAGGALDGNPPPDVKDEILRRTRVFYFNQVMRHSISVEQVREYELSQSNPNPITDGSTPSEEVPLVQPHDDDETRVLTFAELQALIESGREDLIPNNKVIPEALNDAPPSQSTVQPKKKPWEIPGVSSAE